MAKVKLITSLLLVALVLSYGVTSAEGRSLKGQENKKWKDRVMTTTTHENGGSSITRMGTAANFDSGHSKLLENEEHSAPAAPGTITVRAEDDFRPTTPGHSPGAGHSTGPGSSITRMGTAANFDSGRSKLSENEEHSAPAAPGTITDRAEDDFRPTTPGHSPGAGHSTGPGSLPPN